MSHEVYAAGTGAELYRWMLHAPQLQGCHVAVRGTGGPGVVPVLYDQWQIEAVMLQRRVLNFTPGAWGLGVAYRDRETGVQLEFCGLLTGVSVGRLATRQAGGGYDDEGCVVYHVLGNGRQLDTFMVVAPLEFPELCALVMAVEAGVLMVESMGTGGHQVDARFALWACDTGVPRPRTQPVVRFAVPVPCAGDSHRPVPLLPQYGPLVQLYMAEQGATWAEALTLVAGQVVRDLGVDQEGAELILTRQGVDLWAPLWVDRNGGNHVQAV